MIDHFRTALSDPGAQMPDNSAERRTIITRYSLNLLADYATWDLAIHFIIAQRVDSPVGFSGLKLDVVESTPSSSSPYGELVRSQRQAARWECSDAMGVTPFALHFRNKDFSLAEAIRAQNVEESEFGIELAAAKEDLQLPGNFGRLGPKARIIALRNIAPDSQQLLRFLSIGAQANISEQVRSTHPSAASGIGCYFSFCSLFAIAPIPPTTEAVAQWIAACYRGERFSYIWAT